MSGVQISSDVAASVATAAASGAKATQAPVSPSATSGVAERQAVSPGGNSQPVERVEPVSAEELAQAIGELTEYVQGLSRDLQFQVDDSIGRTVVTVLDSETAEVVRQIPSEEVVAIARYIAEYGYDPVKGLLLENEG